MATMTVTLGSSLLRRGVGGQAPYHPCRHQASGAPSHRQSRENVEAFRAEALRMIRLRHPAIVQFYGAFWEVQAYLHSFDPPIVHRDIKAANILVGRTYAVRLGDFGTSRDLENKTMTSTGTLYWMAPEVFIGEYYTEKADVYSFAITLVEMGMSGRHMHLLYGAEGGGRIAQMAAQRHRPDLLLDCVPCDLAAAPGMARLIEAMWASDADSRPDVTIIVVDTLKQIATEQPSEG